MKKLIYLSVLSFTLTFVSCQKDNPIPEVDQEEVSGATLTFTEVERKAHGDYYDYDDIANADIEIITFSGTDMLPPVGAHIHLEKGKTYRFELTTKDFAGRESQHTFVEKDENHFVFILGIPNGAAEVVYKDKKTDGTVVSVGVTGYITVIEETSTAEIRYIMRHLNNDIKSSINPAIDWSNSNFTQFTGANDLDLRFEAHFVDGAHGD